MTTPFIGELRLFSFNFAPRGWAMCNGQTVAINTNAALFSILGTTFGGNGTTNFQLPNMQSRAPMFWGQGPGLPNYALGQTGGEENHTLTLTEMPQHNHGFQATTAAGTKKPVANGLFADDDDTSQNVSNFAPPNAPGSSLVTMDSRALSLSGGSAPHNNMQPFSVTNVCIAIAGIFPSRN